MCVCEPYFLYVVGRSAVEGNSDAPTIRSVEGAKVAPSGRSSPPFDWLAEAPEICRKAGLAEVFSFCGAKAAGRKRYGRVV